MEKEVRSTFWSAHMEAELGTYLLGNPELAAQFTFPVIQCRSSMCEVQAIGYGPEASATWEAAMSDMDKQSWFDFTSVGGPSESRDGTTIILRIFEED
jgi:hypothetical protein